jgi:hypothetical protein
MKRMKYSSFFWLSFVSLSILTCSAQAADEDAFLSQLRQPAEQSLGQGHSAIWAMPLVATQYQPVNPTPAMQVALQAQSEARFLEALILLENESKNVQAGTDVAAELNLLHASFLLQGNQSGQAIALLAPLLTNAKYAADTYALTAMAYLQQGNAKQA